MKNVAFGLISPQFPAENIKNIQNSALTFQDPKFTEFGPYFIFGVLNDI